MAKSTRPSLNEAKRLYVHRYTMEHKPTWANAPHELQSGDQVFYAPQYRSDKEWYDNTKFPGEEGHPGGKSHCYSTAQTWPLGQFLAESYQVGR